MCDKLATQAVDDGDSDEIRAILRVFDDVIDDPAWETHAVPLFYGFRSYASFPIILSDGSFYGTLCAIDPDARHVSSTAVVAALRDRASRIAKLLSASPTNSSSLSPFAAVI
jgi:GAF domain-containing protein